MALPRSNTYPSYCIRRHFQLHLFDHPYHAHNDLWGQSGRSKVPAGIGSEPVADSHGHASAHAYEHHGSDSNEDAYREVNANCYCDLRFFDTDASPDFITDINDRLTAHSDADPFALKHRRHMD